MWIKICANTNADDTLLAAKLGANAVGFVFAASPRQVTPAQARAIGSELPPTIERIGVFQTSEPDQIIQAVHDADLTGAQLHGIVDLNLIRRLRQAFASRITLIQTLHWDMEPAIATPWASIRDQLRQIRQEPAIDRILIDSRIGSLTGGTGVPFDWAAANAALKEELGAVKLIVAGGLRPENVARAIESLHPWGVDVASGVEISAGQKDPKKLEAFIKKASS